MRALPALDARGCIVRETPTPDLRIRAEVSLGNCNCDNWEATLGRAASQLLFKGDYSILVQYCRLSRWRARSCIRRYGQEYWRQSRFVLLKAIIRQQGISCRSLSKCFHCKAADYSLYLDRLGFYLLRVMSSRNPLILFSSDGNCKNGGGEGLAYKSTPPIYSRR